MNENHLRHFVEFSKRQLSSGDIDPMYPVLREVYAKEEVDLETALWRTFLYVTWYNVGSAELAWKRYPSPARLDTIRLPTGTERRAFRGNDLAQVHVNAMYEAVFRPHRSLSAWVRVCVGEGGERGWRSVRSSFQSIPYGGHWSSYKWADLLKNVHGYAITADDIGVGGGGESAGPIPGMVTLTGENWKRCARDVGLQKELLAETRKRGVAFSGLDQLETCLCDYNSLTHGRYYVGHDIDDQQTKLESSGSSEVFWAARKAVFAPRYLGELSGWSGVRKDRKRAFVDRGELV
jgi:hypothetical protein